MLIQPPHQVAGLAGSVGVYEAFRALARRATEAISDVESQVEELRDVAIVRQITSELDVQIGSIAVDGTVLCDTLLATYIGSPNGTTTFVTPTVDGTSGQFLRTNGSGVLSFATVTGFPRLQSSTPGTQDTGHINITGTVLSGKIGKTGGTAQFVLPAIDGSQNQMLKTDGSGNLSFGNDHILLSGSRTLAAAVNSTTEIGSFQSDQGAASLVIHTICDTSGSTMAKTFGVNAVYFSGMSTYFAATPLGNRAIATNDYEVDVVTSNKVTTLRLRRNATDTATALTVYFTVTGTLGASPTITSSSTTGTATLPLSGCHNAGGAIQVGSVSAYAAASAPAGYLLCDGAAVSRTTYARLFSLVGTTFGVGDGSTTFNVPNIAALATGVVYIIRF